MALTFGTEIWRATRENGLVEDITTAIQNGAVNFNTDRRIRRKGSLMLKQSEASAVALRAYTDYIAPFVIITEPGQTTIRQQVGLFMLRTPEGTRYSRLALTTYELNDLTYELDMADFSEPYTVSAAELYTDAAITIIEDMGITHHAIPHRAEAVPNTRTFAPSNDRLDTVNQLLQPVGLTAAFTGGEGHITSSPLLPMASMEPVMTITNEDIQGGVQDSPPGRDPINVVILTVDRANEAPMQSIARNDEVGSPTSTVRVDGVGLGFESVRSEKINDVADQTTLDLMSKAMLSEGRSYYQTSRLVIKPNPIFGGRDVVDLNFDGQLATFNGRWWVRTSSQGLSIKDPTCILEINRTTDTWQGLTI